VPERFLGRSLGKYQVTRVIGTGAYAWVYEARDTDLDIDVALKVLRPEFAGNAPAEARFRREATTAARLRHPHIVTVRDVGQAEGTTYVAMDLLPSTLGRRLDVTGRLPESEVVRLGLDVATALAAAHAAGVVHRDIKPDNILIGEHGEGVVGDFGLARAIEVEVSATGSGIVVGTPQFFSPEQARGIDLDGRSDLYALGVTLFRAATGTLPFDGGDWYSIARRHVEEPPPAPRHLVAELSPDFEAVILRLLAKRPEDRYPDAAALVAALSALPTAPANLPTRELRVLPALLTMERPLPAAETRETPRLPAPRSPGVPASPPPVPAGPSAGARLAVTVLLLAVVAGGWQLARGARRGAGERPAGGTVAPAGPATGTVGTAPLAVEAVSDSLPDLERPPADPTPPAPRNPFLGPSAGRAGLDLRAPESAELYVAGRRVGTGSWRADTMRIGRLAVRASIPTLGDCRTADAVREVRLRAGTREQLVLDVRPCGALRVESTPSEAQFLLDETTTGAHEEGRLPLANRLVVPTGEWTLVILRAGCAEYRTTVRIAAEVEHRERVTLLCN
jgi:hypothetical protein